MTKPHDRLRTMCREARLSADRRDNAPAVVAAAVRLHRDAIRKDDELFDAILASALNPIIRAILKLHTGFDEGDYVRAAQLEMWPSHTHALVEQIGRERVFIPSRDEFVELVPDAMTSQELREAGEHLIGKGEQCIRRGNALVLLSRLHDTATASAA